MTFQLLPSKLAILLASARVPWLLLGHLTHGHTSLPSSNGWSSFLRFVSLSVFEPFSFSLNLSLQYKERLDTASLSVLDFDGQNASPIGFEPVIAHYVKFMSGDDEWDKDMATQAQHRASKIKGELRTVDAEIQALQTEIEQLQAAYVPVTVLKSKKSTLNTDREKFVQLVETTTQHKTLNEEKLRELDSQVVAKGIVRQSCLLSIKPT